MARIVVSRTIRSSLFSRTTKFKNPDQIKLWKSGFMFNIGGRGAAWGLFCLRIYDDPLVAEFGPNLSKEILDTWYTEAETLMEFSLPLTDTIHQNVMEPFEHQDPSLYRCQFSVYIINTEYKYLLHGRCVLDSGLLSVRYDSRSSEPE